VTDESERRRELALVGMTPSWWAARQPDEPAIISPTGKRTFGELNRRANQFARALRARGLGRGDAVALLCTNRPQFAEVVLACQRTGLRLTPVNWHLTGEEAGYIVRDCRAKAVVVDARLGELATAAVTDAPDVTVLLAIDGDVAGFASYEDALAAEDGSDIDDPVLGGSMLYTSGTTGRPKGVERAPVPVTVATGTTAARTNVAARYRAGEGELHLCTGPLYHAAPLAFSLNGPLTYGVGVVLMERWDAEEALRLIDEHRITHTHMVPTMFHRLLSLPADTRAKYDTSSLRYVVHGAAPCPVETKRALIEWLGPIVYEYYAATEGSGASVDSETWLQKPGTVGRPLDGQVLVCDDDGNPLPIGEVGLVFMKAPETGRFRYFGDDDKTASAYRPQGDYFTLGDVGYLDDDGFLFLTDRSANLVISGGVNIYPAEVDAVLLQHPAVGDAATIGIPNAEWGEEVKAVVELQPGVEPSAELADELIEHCRQRLARYKCPRTVDFVDELPRQDNGKIYKRVLRERYRAAGR
jgi:long-chain acyl-CoA synthetase